MGNGTTPADDDDEVTDPSIRTPELDEVPPSSARPPPLPSARAARELLPLRPPLSGRPPPLPLARPTAPSRPPPPSALLRAPPPSAPRPSPTPPAAPHPSSMPPPRAPADAAPAGARRPALPPPRLPSIPPPRVPSPPPSLQLPSAPLPPRASSPPVPATPPLRTAASAPPPRLNESLSYTARRPSDPPPIAAAFDVGRLAQLQRELDEAQDRASKLLAELSSLRPAMLELEAARKRITELEARVLELSTSKPRDDLRRIKGIGPKFEQALRGAGVCTFEQIASWSDADLAEVAAKIGARVDRIEREEWIGKARALLAAP